MTTETLEIIDRRAQTVGAADGNGESAPEAPEAAPETAVVAEAGRVYDDGIPIFDRILIKQGAKETTWGDSRILIPEYVQKAPNMGVVVATAEHYIVDGKAFPMASLVKPGDVVTFSQFNVEEISRNGETFALCSIFDVKLIERVHFALGVAHAAGA